MRPRLVLALLVLPAVASGQRLMPSGVVHPSAERSAFAPPTRLIPRLHTYMNWGTALGATTAALVAAATVSDGAERNKDIIVHAAVGAAVGNLAGLAVGLLNPMATDTLPAPLSPDVLRSPVPVLAARIESASHYVGMGGRIGASVGFLGAFLLADEGRGVAVPIAALEGWVAGMAAGGIMYLVRR